MDTRPVRARGSGPVRLRCAGIVQSRSVRARSGSNRNRIPFDDSPDPVVGERWAEGRLQRSHMLHARRQPAGRSRAGPSKHVAGGRILVRDHRRRRNRPLSCPDDGGGRSRNRYGLARSQEIRRLDDDRVFPSKKRGMLQPRLHSAPPRRGARSLPAAANSSLLRQDEIERRSIRPSQRMGKTELFCTRGIRRSRIPFIPPRRMVAVRGCGIQGGAGRGRAFRRDGLRQACGSRAGRSRFSGLVHLQQTSRRGEDLSHLCAHRRRNNAVGIHSRTYFRRRVLSCFGRGLVCLRRRFPQEGGRRQDGRIRMGRHP